MGIRQKTILRVGALLVLITGVYPPWACVGVQGIRSSIGYQWIFTPPQNACLAASVDLVRLLIEWVIVATLVAALYWIGPEPVPKLARAHSRFPWVQVKEDVYRLDAPGMEILIEYHEAQPGNRFWTYQCVNGTTNALLRFDTSSDAFSYADSLVPSNAVKDLEEKARWRG